MAEGTGDVYPGLQSYGTLSPELKKLQDYFKLWATTTETARANFRRDFEMTEGNGKQWSAADREAVRRTGRPVLEFNQILPQVELVSGMHRASKMEITAVARNLEDRRLGEIAAAALKAASDFGRIDRVSDKVFDDSIICGLGVWEVFHILDDAEDMVWGDISVRRINPMSFIYDPWATQPDLQDGKFMGKAYWMDVETFKRRYPKYAHLAVPGEWLSRSQNTMGASDDLGTGANLIPELWDKETGRIRVMTLWCKHPVTVAYIVNNTTGQVQEVKNKQEGERMLADLAGKMGREAIAPLEVIQSGVESFISMKGMPPTPLADPRTGAPMTYANAEAANVQLNELARVSGMDVYEQYHVISREATRPVWYEMCWWQVLDQGPSPYNDRKYPYVPCISRQFSDDPESIMGIVRNLRDPQDEYNKRYSNLLAHANSSSHSGWLNRKAGGADTSKLELMGSKPGIVVEYGAVKPDQIHPVEMSQGHFAMLQTSERNILRISGINAELVGQTTQQTVSGRAIRARQEGGATILKPRFRTYEEAQLDLARMVLSRIQQFYPPEKIRRIIGVAEAASPMGPMNMGIFQDPVTGQPMPEDQIILLLSSLKSTQFDLVLKMAPQSVTEKQAQFEQAVNIMGLITASGRPIGPNTLQSLMDLSDMPTRLAEGLRRDAMMPPDPMMAGMAQGQNEHVKGMVSNMRGGRAGGSENAPA